MSLSDSAAPEVDRVVATNSSIPLEICLSVMRICSNAETCWLTEDTICCDDPADISAELRISPNTSFSFDERSAPSWIRSVPFSEARIRLSEARWISLILPLICAVDDTVLSASRRTSAATIRKFFPPMRPRALR